MRDQVSRTPVSCYDYLHTIKANKMLVDDKGIVGRNVSLLCCYHIDSVFLSTVHTTLTALSIRHVVIESNPNLLGTVSKLPTE